MATQASIRYPRPFNIRVDDEFIAAVKELQRLTDDVPSQSVVVRQAVLDQLVRKRGDASKRAARR